MPTTMPILAPEKAVARARAFADRGRRWSPQALFIDDIAAVMYRKIDTTPLSATFPQLSSGLNKAVEQSSGRPGSLADYEIGCVVSLFIFSRMTLRPVFAPAGAFSERMTP
jgi:hypothetical protein